MFHVELYACSLPENSSETYLCVFWALNPKPFLLYLCYTASVLSSPFPSSFRASSSLPASSTWANMSAISASSSLFLTLYTSSSCFLQIKIAMCQTNKMSDAFQSAQIIYSSLDLKKGAFIWKQTPVNPFKL